MAPDMQGEDHLRHRVCGTVEEGVRVSNATQARITMESIFEHIEISDILDEIKQTYLRYPLPWVIGYSGGKDSTAVMQLIWTALKQLDPDERTKPVYVIASDTRVETPVIVDHIDNTLSKVNSASDEQNLPFSAQKVMPNLDETFWVNLLGRGYPAPTPTFRWCTERMKINPANRFIKNKVEEYGEVIMVLGTRKAESNTRAQLMNTYEVEGHASLRYHKYLEGAYVYAPIEDFTADDVWTYLFANNSPWGGNNRDLAAIYKTAQEESECPLVIDGSTPSCGDSRFGCWTCTVVEDDVSMRNVIQNGEEWLEPLHQFREKLKKTRNDWDSRSVRGRHGNVRTRNGKVLQGSYSLDQVKEYLKDLLEAQKVAQEHKPDMELVSKEELFEIRRLWRTKGVGSEVDWEDSVPKIYREVYDDDLDWPVDDDGFFDTDQKELLREACENEDDVPVQMVVNLLEAERRSHGMARRADIHKDIRSELQKDWRSDEEILAEAQGEEVLAEA